MTSGVLFDDLLSFDTVQSTWINLGITFQLRDSPSHRKEHGFTSVDKSLYVFGGLGYGSKQTPSFALTNSYSPLQLGCVTSTLAGISRRRVCLLMCGVGATRARQQRILRFCSELNIHAECYSW
jgi:hypothetical protein